MTTYALNTATEKKDKKKSLRISMVIHVALGLLLLIPLATQIDLDKEPAMTQVVMVDFNDFKAASAESSAKAGEPETEPTEKEAVAEPVEAEPVEAEPVKEMTKEPAKIKTKPTRKPAPKDRKVVVPTKPTVEKAKPVEKPAPKPAKAPVKKPAEVKPTGQKGHTGVGTQGSSTKGDAKTDGKADKGKQGMDFEGDALFARRVIKRAEIKQLSKKKGTIVVNLCVNQNGSVVYAEFNKSDSDIYDADLVKEAIQATYKYRFEPDYTAPVKQCGKLTYIIKIK